MTTENPNQPIFMDVLRVSSRGVTAFEPYVLPTPCQQENAPGTMGEVPLEEVKHRGFVAGQRLKGLLVEEA